MIVREIERDEFPFEFLSRLAERESWRKEIHRPIYHVHKWWAKRLGSVFRGILIGAASTSAGVQEYFYRQNAFSGVVFDPFMGSGTTIGEAHKLGFTALGRDINPVAVDAVRVALGPLDETALRKALVHLLDQVGVEILRVYKSRDSSGKECDVLYFFWVMQAACPSCSRDLDLFSSYVIAANAYPKKKPEVQVVCPKCGDIAACPNRHQVVVCRRCAHEFQPDSGIVKGARGQCTSCRAAFQVGETVRNQGARYRLFGKLVMSSAGKKEYLPVTEYDLESYRECEDRLRQAEESGEVRLPTLKLADGYNTRQAMSYGFQSWRDFFNARQLYALGKLRAAIDKIEDGPVREAMRILFSGTLEFNNLFTSYKGEGTGAVRHMFAHHVLKPERTPIEANPWGTPKSSGAFSNLFNGRIIRAIGYRRAPVEVGVDGGAAVLASKPFSGSVETQWPFDGVFRDRGIYLSCGDSSSTGLPDRTVDLVVTDPPFFDNVHYSELADFFAAWKQPGGAEVTSTRKDGEVQDGDAESFARKLAGVFRECSRILKRDGLLVFTYHHSRAEGWESLMRAILGAGMLVVNAHPVKAEMSVAQPKLQAKSPIQIDIVVVCRHAADAPSAATSIEAALTAAERKIKRMEGAGFELSGNDKRVTIFGQLLTTVRDLEDARCLSARVEQAVARGLDVASAEATVSA